MVAELARAFISFGRQRGPKSTGRRTKADPRHTTMTDRRFGRGAKRSPVDSGHHEPRASASRLECGRPLLASSCTAAQPTAPTDAPRPDSA
uniref:Uncharacterized protein n=1 Tax=Plectus sambesii TaxID=2011161 RepID=A0A914W1V5_9BILA